MDELTCKHCDEHITELTRTGDKRFMCNHCSKVVPFADVEPYIEEESVEVIDKRDSLGEDNDPDDSGSNGSSGNSGNGSASGEGASGDSDQNPVTTAGTMDEQEIIRQRGAEGLHDIKKRRLRSWLQDTKGVGNQTIERVLKVFDNNSRVSRDPNELFNYLDDELSSTDKYLNTLVQTVFSPEDEHRELLRQHGYNPSNNIRGQGQLGEGQTMNGRNNRPQGGQGTQQPQGQSQSQGMSREEAVQMIKAAQEDDDEGSRRRGPATDALDAATEEAIQNMASNMGGLFGTAQRLIESTLMSYFEDNPEKLVENMDLIQTFMEGDTQNNTNTQEPEPRSEEDAKIDSALDDIREDQGLEPTNAVDNTEDTSPEPEQNEQEDDKITMDDGPTSGEDPLAEFDTETQNAGGGGSEPETQQDGPATQEEQWNTANGAEPDYNDTESDENESTTVTEEQPPDEEDENESSSDEEDDWFAQEFDDAAVQG